MFKVPESPHTASCTSQRHLKAPNTLCSPVKNTNPKRDIFKTPEKTCKMSPRRVSENTSSLILTQEKSSEDLHHRLKTPVKSDAVSLLEQSTPPGERLVSPKPNSKTRTPSPTHLMITRSGRSPGKSSNISSPFKPVLTPGGGAAVSVKSPAKSLTRTRSGQGFRTTRHNLRSQSSENVPSYLNPGSDENCDPILQSDSEEAQAEPSQTSEPDTSSPPVSQPFDSSHMNSASTDDDSLGIVDAAVVKTQFTGGLKMSISFSRKPSQSGEDFLSSAVPPKPRVSPQGTPGRSYGFRQTPDRQQREAAARLGYGSESPRFSTPRGPASSCRQKEMHTPNSLTYQVEMEIQTSGLPKLKIKRTDSMSTGDVAAGAQSPVVGMNPSQLESPLALFSKHRDPGCVSPSICTHVTPGKSTPGKGVQTYICQSYTPTHNPAGIVAIAETIPLTPSPQSVGKTAPDGLNSWPRRKRAQAGVLGGKDRGLKGEPLLAELLEEAELGVSRLQDVEDTEEPLNNKAASIQSPSVGTYATPLAPLEDFYWMEKLAQQAECADPQTAEEEMIRATADGDVKSCKL